MLRSMDAADIDVRLPDTYPMDRSRTCPLDPPAEYARFRAERPITRITLDFDGSEVWLVTRYEDARTILGDPRFSSDFSTPGFPARLTAKPLLGLTKARSSVVPVAAQRSRSSPKPSIASNSSS